MQYKRTQFEAKMKILQYFTHQAQLRLLSKRLQKIRVRLKRRQLITSQGIEDKYQYYKVFITNYK